MLKHLLKDIKKHYWQYFILLVGVFSGISAFFLLAGMPNLRIISVVLLGLFYFLWGTGHHLSNKDWHLRVSLEYLLVAIIACGLLLSLILRS